MRYVDKYTDSVKFDAISRYRKERNFYKVSKDLGIPRATIRSWVKHKVLSKQFDEHDHHFVIESPNGPTSMGACKICLETREFHNSFEDSGWPVQRRMQQQLRL